MPEDGEGVLFGKKVNDLQTGITINENNITGTLNYVTGYTEFSSNVSEQSGNYLALKVDFTPADAVTTVEVVGGTKGAVTLDEDKNIVLLIKNTTQSVKVITSKDGAQKEKTYTLSGLTLKTE